MEYMPRFVKLEFAGKGSLNLKPFNIPDSAIAISILYHRDLGGFFAAYLDPVEDIA